MGTLMHQGLFFLTFDGQQRQLVIPENKLFFLSDHWHGESHVRRVFASDWRKIVLQRGRKAAGR